MRRRPNYVRRLQEKYKRTQTQSRKLKRIVWLYRLVCKPICAAPAVAVVLVLVLLLLRDLSRNYVVVEPFDIPLSLQVAGIRSDVMAKALIDRIGAMEGKSSVVAERHHYIYSPVVETQLDWETLERGIGSHILHAARDLVQKPVATVLGHCQMVGDSTVITLQVQGMTRDPTSYTVRGTLNDFEPILDYLCHSALIELAPYKLASYLYSLDKDSSLAVVQHCLTHQPTDDDHLAYYLWGIILHDDRKNDGAIDKYDKSIELRPEFSWPYVNKGVVLMDQKRYDAALSMFLKAAEIDRDDAINLVNLGRAHNLLEQSEAGRSALERAIAIDPFLPAAYFNLGVSFHKLGDSAQAHSMYCAAIELDSTFASAYFSMGVLCHDKDEFSDAIDYYLLAIEHDSTHSPAYSDCGVALADLGMVDSALVMWEKAATIDSTDPKPHLNWGYALFSRGEYTSAITQYEMTIRLCPECSTAITAQQWVDSAKARLFQ